jgi:CheY-like chemotaxis protein
VAKQIREQRSLRGVLVALTGYGQESDRERSLGAGFNHHLTKPLDYKKLEQILATAS